MFGGRTKSHPKPTYSADHDPAIRVPKGGSSCSSCEYLGDDRKTCKNSHYVAWNNGSNKLLFPADEFCSDWYEPGEGALKEKR